MSSGKREERAVLLKPVASEGRKSNSGGYRAAGRVGWLPGRSECRRGGNPVGACVRGGNVRVGLACERATLPPGDIIKILGQNFMRQ